jgi:CheY-like chemotaxis protein
VLFMSGYTEDAILDRGALRKGAEFIQKPFSPDQLAGKVREMLGVTKRAARILVVDDEAGVRDFLRMVLEGGGYDVIEAANGKEAIQQIRTGRVDLLITDLVMPEQEGIETIAALRKEVPGIRIIAISGAFGGKFLHVARLLGVGVALTKPVDADQLLAKVAELLSRR